jgi:hypothetical protein
MPMPFPRPKASGCILRRELGNDCVFHRHRGVPHHLTRHRNKLDYSVKLKEYLDKYLQSAPAAE